MSDQNPEMPGHNYDGITELDNTLPRWWLYLFYLTILFSAIYLVHYHVTGTGALSGAEYEQEVAAAQKAPAVAAAAPDGGAAPAVAAAPALPTEPLTDAASLEKGKGLFMVNCMVCHAPDGGGLIGPNLCDDSFIHGAAFVDSVHTIYEGVPAKGMITWKTVLKPDDIHAVASYIWTLRGTTPATPKAPEGIKAGT